MIVSLLWFSGLECLPEGYDFIDFTFIHKVSFFQLLKKDKILKSQIEEFYLSFQHRKRSCIVLNTAFLLMLVWTDGMLPKNWDIRILSACIYEYSLYDHESNANSPMSWGNRKGRSVFQWRISSITPCKLLRTSTVNSNWINTRRKL